MFGSIFEAKKIIYYFKYDRNVKNYKLRALSDSLKILNEIRQMQYHHPVIPTSSYRNPMLSILIYHLEQKTAIDFPTTSIISRDVVATMHHATDRLYKQAGRRLITGLRCYLAVYYTNIEKVSEFMRMKTQDWIIMHRWLRKNRPINNDFSVINRNIYELWLLKYHAKNWCEVTHQYWIPVTKLRGQWIISSVADIDGVFDVLILDELNVFDSRDIEQIQSRVATRVRHAFHVRHSWHAAGLYNVCYTMPCHHSLRHVAQLVTMITMKNGTGMSLEVGMLKVVHHGHEMSSQFSRVLLSPH